jgi:hypothetical protein
VSRIQAVVSVQEVNDRGFVLWKVQAVGESGVVCDDMLTMAQSAVSTSASIVATAVQAESIRRAAGQT